MSRTTRKMVKIDLEKCDGCGQCVIACAEGAIEIVDGKARLVSETYCDGLGACLGECPLDAITIEEREAEKFDEGAVEEHLAASKPSPASGCPSMAFAPPVREGKASPRGAGASDRESTLSQWPVQLMLLGPGAPIFSRPGGTDLAIVADCVPFAYAGFHEDFLRGTTIAIGCPKLDDASLYVDKLAEILRQGNIKSLSVLHMEVPCCFGLQRIVTQAVAASGKEIPIKEVTIGVDGEVK